MTQTVKVPHIPFPLPSYEEFWRAKAEGLRMRLARVHPIPAKLQDTALCPMMVDKLMNEGLRLMQASPQFWCFVREVPDEVELPKLVDALRQIGASTDFLLGVALVTATTYATIH